ncbi:hypothetical protein K438DRAFT_1878956 [Mycena galopus ATCC 62051]|nr:hypothetical protein K438DRAFT_1878956 [Mycena galopus ATCC 62051]
MRVTATSVAASMIKAVERRSKAGGGESLSGGGSHSDGSPGGGSSSGNGAGTLTPAADSAIPPHSNATVPHSAIPTRPSQITNSAHVFPLQTLSTSQSVGPKSTIHLGTLAAIAVAVTMFLLCLAATVLWQIRHRRRQKHTAKHRDMENTRAFTTISPFTLIPQATSAEPGSENATLGEDSDARSISASTIPRQRLEMQLRAATEKMGDLEDQARGDGTTGGSGIREIWRRVSGRSAETRSSPDVEAQLRAEIDLLHARINAMEANSDAAWGRIVGDEPPPEYGS